MICSIHQVEMRHYTNEKGSWDSHKLDDGSWCNGKSKNGDSKPITNGVSKSYSKSPEESAKISRMHAQEMSLRFMTLLVKTGQVKEITSDLVKKYTDHFVKDAENSFDEFAGWQPSKLDDHQSEIKDSSSD